MTILAGLELAYPIDGNGKYTSFYAEPRPYNAWGLELKHEGVDIAPLPVGRRAWALAAYRGGIFDTGYDPRYMGHWVEMVHSDEYGAQFFTRYHHLEYAIVVTGQEKEQGAQLGVVGKSGFATGNHLHFMVYVKIGGKPKPLDPLWFLPYRGGKGAQG